MIHIEPTMIYVNESFRGGALEHRLYYVYRRSIYESDHMILVLLRAWLLCTDSIHLIFVANVLCSTNDDSTIMSCQCLLLLRGWWGCRANVQRSSNVLVHRALHCLSVWPLDPLGGFLVSWHRVSFLVLLLRVFVLRHVISASPSPSLMPQAP